MFEKEPLILDKFLSAVGEVVVKVAKTLGYYRFKQGVSEGEHLATKAVLTELNQRVASASLPQLVMILWNTISLNRRAALLRNTFCLSLLVFGFYGTSDYVIKHILFKLAKEREYNLRYEVCTILLHEMLSIGKISILQYNEYLAALRLKRTSDDLHAFIAELLNDTKNS